MVLNRVSCVARGGVLQVTWNLSVLHSHRRFSLPLFFFKFYEWRSSQHRKLDVSNDESKKEGRQMLRTQVLRLFSFFALNDVTDAVK